MLSLQAGCQLRSTSSAACRTGCAPTKATATHQLQSGESARGFNQEYIFRCEHYGLMPATINRTCSQENGDIESANGHLKRRLKTHLALHGSSYFANEAIHAAFVAQSCGRCP